MQNDSQNYSNKITALNSPNFDSFVSFRLKFLSKVDIFVCPIEGTLKVCFCFPFRRYPMPLTGFPGNAIEYFQKTRGQSNESHIIQKKILLTTCIILLTINQCVCVCVCVLPVISKMCFVPCDKVQICNMQYAFRVLFR